MKKIFVLIVCLINVYSDTIFLSSGKKVTGKIISYSQNGGLLVETDFGEITIKPGNLVSFEIDTNIESEIEEKIKYTESKLYNLGIRIDTLGLDGYDIKYDSKLENNLFELLAINNSKSIYLIMGGEELDLENKEYVGLIEKNIRGMSQYFVDGESWKLKSGKIDYLMRSFKVKLNGMELSYFVGCFKIDTMNYRLIMWGFPTILKKEKDRFEKFAKKISFIKK